MGGVGLLSSIAGLYAMIRTGERNVLTLLWPGAFFGYLVSTALLYLGYPLPRHQDLMLAAASSAIGFVTILAAAIAHCELKMYGQSFRYFLCLRFGKPERRKPWPCCCRDPGLLRAKF
jgi:membrane protein DedA with SNARE-associated domain